jgi:hypothetical protein
MVDLTNVKNLLLHALKHDPEDREIGSGIRWRNRHEFFCHTNTVAQQLVVPCSTLSATFCEYKFKQCSHPKDLKTLPKPEKWTLYSHEKLDSADIEGSFQRIARLAPEPQEPPFARPSFRPPRQPPEPEKKPEKGPPSGNGSQGGPQSDDANGLES